MVCQWSVNSGITANHRKRKWFASQIQTIVSDPDLSTPTNHGLQADLGPNVRCNAKSHFVLSHSMRTYIYDDVTRNQC